MINLSYCVPNLADITSNTSLATIILLLMSVIGAVSYRLRGGWDKPNGLWLPFGTQFARIFYGSVFTGLLVVTALISKVQLPAISLIGVLIASSVITILFPHGCYQQAGRESVADKSDLFILSFLDGIKNLVVRDSLGLFFIHLFSGCLIALPLLFWFPGLAIYPPIFGLLSTGSYLVGNWMLPDYEVWVAELGVGFFNTLTIVSLLWLT